MQPQRVHILGASGSGTTTLGRALADAWAVPHADVDDYFWEPTEPPYAIKRDPLERLELMRQVFLPRAAWVLSGSLAGWGDELIALFDSVVFVTSTNLRARGVRDLQSSRDDLAHVVRIRATGARDAPLGVDESANTAGFASARSVRATP